MDWSHNFITLGGVILAIVTSLTVKVLVSINLSICMGRCSVQGESRFAGKYQSTGPTDALALPEHHMVPVALVAKLAPILGGLTREVPARFVGGMFGLPVLSYFIHILELLFASIALQTIFDAVSCTLKIIVGCSLHHEFSCEFQFLFLS